MEQQPPRRFRAKKKWGQNFLIDQNTIDLVCDQIELFYEHVPCKDQSTEKQGSPQAVEIGAGKGALTRCLLKRGWSVIAWEIDPWLVEYIEKDCQRYNTNGKSTNFFQIHHCDAINVLCSLQKIAKNKKNNNCSYQQPRMTLSKEFLQQLSTIPYIYGNLPYSLATKILIELAQCSNFTGGIFILAKEIVQKIVNQDGSLGIFLASLADWREIDLSIVPAAFSPRPKKIISKLITYRRYDEPKANLALLSLLLKMSFGGRRKKIKNSWKKQYSQYQSQLHKVCPYITSLDIILEAARKINFPLTIRPEDIQGDYYYQLAKDLFTTS